MKKAVVWLLWAVGYGVAMAIFSYLNSYLLVQYDIWEADGEYLQNAAYFGFVCFVAVLIPLTMFVSALLVVGFAWLTAFASPELLESMQIERMEVMTAVHLSVLLAIVMLPFVTRLIVRQSEEATELPV